MFNQKVMQTSFQGVLRESERRPSPGLVLFAAAVINIINKIGFPDPRPMHTQVRTIVLPLYPCCCFDIADIGRSWFTIRDEGLGAPSR